MNTKDFFDFYNSVSTHNMEIQKQLEKDNHILVVSQLIEYVKKFPLADIYLHYPQDNQINDLLFCYSVDHEGPNQLLPVLSSYLSEEKIILSYLQQTELDKLDFSGDFPVTDHYMNSVRVVKYLFNEKMVFSPRNSSMIFIEHIPDSLQWKYDCPNHKIYQAFSLIMVSNLMLWEAFYFTPHY